MRFAPLYTAVTTTLLLSTSIATAQTSAAQMHSSGTAQSTAIAPRTSSLLSISTPPYARLRLDVDARDEDVLGVAKSFLRGFKGQNLKDLLASLKQSGAASSPTTSAQDVQNAAAIQMLSDADLGTILRDIHHLRVVFFEMPRGRSGGSGVRKPQSVIEYYEEAYLAREGGRRIARGDFDEVQVLSVGFPQGGFGMVFQMENMGLVMRSDGYPNYEGVGPLMMSIMLQAALHIKK